MCATYSELTCPVLQDIYVTKTSLRGHNVLQTSLICNTIYIIISIHHLSKKH